MGRDFFSFFLVKNKNPRGSNAPQRPHHGAPWHGALSAVRSLPRSVVERSRPPDFFVRPAKAFWRHYCLCTARAGTGSTVAWFTRRARLSTLTARWPSANARTLTHLTAFPNEHGFSANAVAVAKPLGLSVRGTGGEHTPIGADCTCEILPSNGLFFTEGGVEQAVRGHQEPRGRRGRRRHTHGC
jgi:hypothetical protein